MRSFESLPSRLPYITLTLVLGAGALGACTTPEETQAATDTVPLVDRYEYDFAGGTIKGHQRQDSNNCMEDTSYNTSSQYKRGGAAASLALQTDGLIVIHPAGIQGNDVALHLRNMGADKPLQPADEQAARTLDSYGCNYTSYDK